LTLLLLLSLLQMLAHEYDLHPLAVEDVLHFQRIKAVTYSGWCFLGVLHEGVGVGCCLLAVENFVHLQRIKVVTYSGAC
jgi:hypothetical protein